MENRTVIEDLDEAGTYDVKIFDDKLNLIFEDDIAIEGEKNARSTVGVSVDEDNGYVHGYTLIEYQNTYESMNTTMYVVRDDGVQTSTILETYNNYSKIRNFITYDILHLQLNGTTTLYGSIEIEDTSQIDYIYFVIEIDGKFLRYDISTNGDSDLIQDWEDIDWENLGIIPEASGDEDTGINIIAMIFVILIAVLLLIILLLLFILIIKKLTSSKFSVDY